MLTPCVNRPRRRWEPTVDCALVLTANIALFQPRVLPHFKPMTREGLIRRFCTSHALLFGALAGLEADLQTQSKCVDQQASFPVLI